MTDALPLGAAKPRESHVWERHQHDWYQEPPWCSSRLFDVEMFLCELIDPCCGGGNIVRAAREHHLPAEGWDLVDRGFPGAKIRDWLAPCNLRPCNIVCNPPFALAQQFVELALERARSKVAILFPVPRLNAAQWLRALPLTRVWLLTPRPSMPPGEVILRGEKSRSGREDYCWLVFEIGHPGSPSLRWLHRDEG